MWRSLIVALGATVLLGTQAYAGASVTIRIGTPGWRCSAPRRTRQKEQWRWFQRPSGKWVLKVRVAWYDYDWDCWRFGPWTVEYVGCNCYHHGDHWFHHPHCRRRSHRCQPKRRGRYKHHWGVHYEYEYHGPRGHHKYEYHGKASGKHRPHAGCKSGCSYEHRQRRHTPHRHSPAHIDKPPVRRRPVRPVPGVHRADNRLEKRRVQVSRPENSRKPKRIELGSRPASRRSSKRIIRVSDREGR